jgi:cytochrome c-type biogenesis protein CcmH/NrfG
MLRTLSITDLTRLLKEAFKEALTSLQQDRKLYLTEEDWDARGKKREGRTILAAIQEAVAWAKVAGKATVVGVVALHWVGS